MRKIDEKQIKARVLNHIIFLFSGKTIRQISELTGWSKTVVHQDLTDRAESLYPEYTEKIKKFLSLNYNMRGVYGVNSRNLQYKDTEKLKNYHQKFKEIF